MIPSVSLLIFSPTGSTKRIVAGIGNQLASSVTQCNLMSTNGEKRVFGADDLVIVGVPVYAGRVPDAALKAIKKFSGKQTPAVSVVVYGNRAYDDALLELNDTLKESGFTILASAAFVAQHSIVNSVAQGRPDEDDREDIASFAAAIRQKYTKVNKSEWKNITVPGNKPYKTHSPAGIAPYATEKCTNCKTCIRECPTNAIISAEETSPEKCILCMRCIAVCPHKARVLPEEFLKRISGYLAETASTRRNNEIFV